MRAALRRRSGMPRPRHLPAKALSRALPVPEVAEVFLLLPAWELDPLARAAQQRGLTAAQLVRLLVSGFLRRAEGRPCLPPPAAGPSRANRRRGRPLAPPECFT